MSKQKSGLGRGLDLLLSDNYLEQEVTNKNTVRLSSIEPNPHQPRKEFDEEKLEELAQSIREMGLIQPIIVREIANDRYVIVAGERRWRACKLAGVSEVPVIIQDYSDTDSMVVALVENLQRENLNPIEEALGFKTLIEQLNLTQDNVAKKVGKSRSAVTNALRILSLPESILKMIKLNEITSGHARALLTLDFPDEMEILAKLIAEQSLSVRETEAMAKSKRFLTAKEKGENPPKSLSMIDAHYRELESTVEKTLGCKTRIKHGKKKGKIEIEYYNNEELEHLLTLLGVKI